jgi:mRNA interferase ChpB
MAAFDKGDIVRACLNPTAGKETQGDYRPCLVISPKAFNKLGLTLIAPITQGGNFARTEGFTVPLIGAGTEIQGVVLVNAVRTVDLQARKAVKIEKAPAALVNEVVAILMAIIE